MKRVDYETLETCIKTIRQAVAVVDEAMEQKNHTQPVDVVQSSRKRKNSPASPASPKTKSHKKKVRIQDNVEIAGGNEEQRRTSGLVRAFAQVAALTLSGDLPQPKGKKGRINKKMELILPMRFQAQVNSRNGKKTVTGVLCSVAEKSRGRVINYEVDIRAVPPHVTCANEVMQYAQEAKGYKSLSAYFREEFNQKSGNLYASVTLENGLTLDQCRKQRVIFKKSSANDAALAPIQNIESTIVDSSEESAANADGNPNEAPVDSQAQVSEAENADSSAGVATTNPDASETTEVSEVSETSETSGVVEVSQVSEASEVSGNEKTDEISSPGREAQEASTAETSTTEMEVDESK